MPLKNKTMKQDSSIKNITLLVAFALLTQVASAQLAGHLYTKKVIGVNPTLMVGDMTVHCEGELFLGCYYITPRQIKTLFQVGNYEGRPGAKVYLSIIDNSNDRTARGFFNIVGTAVGTTEVILGLFDGWNGERIDLVRAHNAGSDSLAFVMQDVVANDKIAYLNTRVEGSDRVWFIAERVDLNVVTCLPHLIIQVRNNTLTIDNNPLHNGGFNFVYYKWFRNDELVHEGRHGAGLGGVLNTGRTNLSPHDTYHAILTDQHGNHHNTCPYNPVALVPVLRIIVYPNPTTVDRTLVMVDVETDDGELLANGVITVFNVLGYNFGQVRTNGHRVTPIRLPSVSGTYFLEFVSGSVREVIRVVVY